MNTDGWFYEDYVDGAGTACSIDNLLYAGRTDFQEVLIFENRFFGKVLVLDGVIQTTTMDEAFYHEMLVHLPIIAHGGVVRVLIVGGGDGGALRRALQHPGVVPTIVDIDDEVVQLCREHMPEIGQGAFEDPRADYVHGDGFEYLRSVEAEFDVIICDVTDPMGGPGDVLHSEAFFRACKHGLRHGGVVVIQSGIPDHEQARHRRLVDTMGPVFADRAFYVVPMPSYFGGFMSVGWGCEDPSVREAPLRVIGERFARSDISTEYYTPEIHRASFVLPRYFLEAIGG